MALRALGAPEPFILTTSDPWHRRPGTQVRNALTASTVVQVLYLRGVFAQVRTSSEQPAMDWPDQCRRESGGGVPREDHLGSIGPTVVERFPVGIGYYGHLGRVIARIGNCQQSEPEALTDHLADRDHSRPGVSDFGE